MTDELVSLFSLMDSHLTKLDQFTLDNGGNNAVCSASHIVLHAPPRISIPKYFQETSPMKDFLAEQIANTLKVKEIHEQEGEKTKERKRILKIYDPEERNIEDEMKMLNIGEDEPCYKKEVLTKSKSNDKQEYIIDQEDITKSKSNDKQEQIIGQVEITKSKFNDKQEKIINQVEITKSKFNDNQENFIDLTTAVIPKPESILEANLPIVSNNTSNECPRTTYTNIPTISDIPLMFDKETCLYKPWDPELPCITDIKFILKKKIYNGKCSNLGKVICSKTLPVYHISLPYVIQTYTANIVRFDFKTKSPGDICKENIVKTKVSTRWTDTDIMDIMETNFNQI